MQGIKKNRIAIKMYESKNYRISEITEATGVSKSKLYRYKTAINKKY